MSRGAAFLAWALVLASLTVPVAALGVPPSNDNRSGARALSFPGSVAGTLVEATQEPEGEPFGCSTTEGSVWYRFEGGANARVALRLLAFGDLDATLEVYRRVRSQLVSAGCEPTDETGRAGMNLRVERGDEYFVRVTRRAGSTEDTFLLESFVPAPPASPPGPALPDGGVRGMLDRLGNEDDAWAVRLRAGVTYRINESDQLNACLPVSIFGPGSRSFGGSPARSLGCGGYGLFTPGPGASGAYSILVRAIPWLRGPQNYRIQVQRAGVDDTVPGRRLDHASRGSVDSGHIDVVDLYRFDVVRRSDVTLTLGTRGALNLTLRREGGELISCACNDSGGLEISERLKRGRYYASVQAQPRRRGRYVLRKLARIITRTRTSVGGMRRRSVRPGRTVSLRVRVGPGATGPVRLTLERRDPNAGWQFHRRLGIRVSRGSGSIDFTPPTLGSYRIRAEFLGTRRFAPSVSKLAHVRVVEPIRR